MNTNRLYIQPPQNEPILTYGPGTREKTTLKAEIKAQKSSCVDIPVVIDGKEYLDLPTFEVRSPHNKNQVLATCRVASPKLVTQAIESSLQAAQEWADLPWEDRAAVFLKAADLVSTKYRAQMNAATILGQSKNIYQAEIDAACEVIDFFRFNAYFSEQIHLQQPISPPSGHWNRMKARALEGFVYAISPFNFTAISVNLASAPALMGCPVLLKPAQGAVLSSYYAIKILEEAGLPPGVIQFVPGDARTITNIALTHPHLAGIHFTGSTGVFNNIWKTVGENIGSYRTYPRIVGETGGKDFIFAHESADPASLVTAIIRGAFEYQGQKCSAASRAYIPKQLWKKIKPLLAEQIRTIKVGNPEDFSTFMGAVIDQKAYDKIKSYIDFSKSSPDLTIVCGGEASDKEGFFIYPTLLETSNPAAKTMVEEIFGPIITVYSYDEENLENTLSICEQTSPYALTGAIFAQDRRVIQHMSQKLKNAAGNFYINDKPTGAMVGQQPFGGARASGTNDKAGSVYNLLRWVSHQTIKETFISVTDYHYPHMSES